MYSSSFRRLSISMNGFFAFKPATLIPITDNPAPDANGYLWQSSDTLAYARIRSQQRYFWATALQLEASNEKRTAVKDERKPLEPVHV